MSRALTASIVADHDDLRQYHAKYLEAKSDNTERTKWANMFRWKLAVHSVAEEIVWYPEIERVFGGAEGKKLADQNRAEHQIVKVDLEKFEKLSVDDAEFAVVFNKIFKELKTHMEEEENNELPNFEAKISEQDSATIAKKFDRTKKLVPTHSHPSAPNKPPFETIAGLFATPLDKIKDIFASFPDSSSNK